MSRVVGRRSVLRLGALAAVGLAITAGCREDEKTPGADEAGARRALTQLLAVETELVDRYRNEPSLPGSAALFDHEAHLVALRERLRQPSSVPPAPDEVGVGNREGAQLESAVADFALAKPLDRRVGDVVALCASLAACELSHAAALGETVETEPTATIILSKSAISAGNQTLAALHAAIYGYGVAGSHALPRQADAIAAAQDHHRLRRDSLIAALTAAGTTPAGALPSYELPFTVDDSTTALLLGIHLEQGVARAWRTTCGVLEHDVRRPAQLALADAAITAAAWRRASDTNQAGVSQLGTVAWPGA